VTHTEVSGVAHYALDDDEACLRKLRDLVERLPRKADRARGAAEPAPGADGDGAAPHALYSLLPSDHRMPYDMHAVLRTFLDDGRIDEFQQNLAREMICGDARVGGMAVGVIANQRGLIKGRPGERARFGGIVYAESAEKLAFFIDRCDRQGIPLLFVQDVSASWWAPTPSTRGSSARARASWRRWPPRGVAKIVLTVNHASGRGLLRDGGPGLRPRLHLLLAHRADGGDGGRGGVQAVHGPAIDKAKRAGDAIPPEVARSMDEMRADYEHQLDAKYAAGARLRGRGDPPRGHAAGAHHGAAHLPAQQRAPLRALRTPQQPRRGPVKRVVRVASGQGFWGDSLDAPRQQVEGGPVDYLMLDYLAEVTMSILQKQKERDPSMGYARDFVARWRACCRRSSSAGVRVIAKRGRREPPECARPARAAGRAGAELRIGVVTVRRPLPPRRSQSPRASPLLNRTTRRGARDRCATACSRPQRLHRSEPNRRGFATAAAQVEVTGSPPIPRSRWPAPPRVRWVGRDWDTPRPGSSPGTSSSGVRSAPGGNCLYDWRNIPDLAERRLPDRRGHRDGTFTVTKHPGTGGRISTHTCRSSSCTRWATRTPTSPPT
jgi:hypothetical protein